jgi:predicted phosphodiesterase
MRFVFGNNDGERAGLKKKCLEMGYGEIDDTIEIELQGKKIFVNHGTDPRIIDQAAESQKYDYIFTGHTHRKRNELQGRTRIVNPGALFMAKEYSFATLDLASGEVNFVTVEK